MPTPLAVQLYSLREQCAENLEQTLDTVAEIGYRGVEAAGWHGRSVAEFQRLCADRGLEIAASHKPWCRPDSVDEAIETAQALGLDLVGGGYGRDQFASLDAVKATAEEINGLTAKLKPHGLKLFLHNHWWEFVRFDGRIAHHLIHEWCPDVLFEIDTYWSANFGAETPAEQVAFFASRAPLLHIKDGPLAEGQAHVAVGSGKMDIPAVITAANPEVLRWLVVELDKCDTDMVAAVRGSHAYLTGAGLAAGR